MWLRVSIAGVAVLASVEFAGQEPDAMFLTERSEQYQAAYQDGRGDADAELKVGRVTIYTCGLRDLFENLDRKTGHPYQPIAGCVIDDAILGRSKGHNDRVREWIAAHGLPANSFKPWEKELFGLRDYYTSRTKAERPSRLTIGGSSLKSPDGRYTIRPVKARLGSGREVLGVVVSEETVTQPPASILWDEGDTEMLWGPKGSGFAVLCCKTEQGTHYMALDLRRGEWLREEWDRSASEAGSARVAPLRGEES